MYNTVTYSMFIKQFNIGLHDIVCEHLNMDELFHISYCVYTNYIIDLIF